MLMPMVAMMKVIEPMKTATLLSMRETISTGSISISPKTETEPAVTMTTMMAKSRKLTGAEEVADLHLLLHLPKREKSPKLRRSAAK